MAKPIGLKEAVIPRKNRFLPIYRVVPFEDNMNYLGGQVNYPQFVKTHDKFLK
jgi:hypothetical protein